MVQSNENIGHNMGSDSSKTGIVRGNYVHYINDKFQVLLTSGQIIIGTGWILIGIGIISLVLGLSFGKAGLLAGLIGASVIAGYGILMIVVGQSIACFVSMEKYTRGSYELLKRQILDTNHTQQSSELASVNTAKISIENKSPIPRNKCTACNTVFEGHSTKCPSCGSRATISI